MLNILLWIYIIAIPILSLRAFDPATNKSDKLFIMLAGFLTGLLFTYALKGNL